MTPQKNEPYVSRENSGDSAEELDSSEGNVDASVQSQKTITMSPVTHADSEMVDKS